MMRSCILVLLIILVVLVGCTGEGITPSVDLPEMTISSTTMINSSITSVVTPDSISTQTPTDSRPENTPTMDFGPTSTRAIRITELADQWVLFIDEEVGVSFEFPAVYDQPDYRWCTPYASKSDNSSEIYISYTETSYWTFIKPKKQTADDLLAEILQTIEDDDAYSLSDVHTTEILGSMGHVINYHVSGRFNSISFADLSDDMLVIIDWNPRMPRCDFPEIGLSFSDAIDRFEETLQLLE